jgi:glucose-1-phosphate cytidylyltransferase
MVEIGGRPILWHIMKGLSTHGVHDFVIATGYRSSLIKDYFLHYSAYAQDFTVELGTGALRTHTAAVDEHDWKVTVAYTGELTPTGGRLLSVASYVAGERFLLTYGDGLSDVDVSQLVAAHEKSGSLATITAVRPLSRFGQLALSEGNSVTAFTEKPRMDSWVNGGFMIMESEVLDLLTTNSVLEGEPLSTLAKAGRLGAYRHEGFWQPMDTYREYQELSEMWSSGAAPWKTWR